MCLFFKLWGCWDNLNGFHSSILPILLIHWDIPMPGFRGVPVIIWMPWAPVSWVFDQSPLRGSSPNLYDWRVWLEQLILPSDDRGAHIASRVVPDWLPCPMMHRGRLWFIHWLPLCQLWAWICPIWRYGPFYVMLGQRMRNRIKYTSAPRWWCQTPLGRGVDKLWHAATIHWQRVCTSPLHITFHFIPGYDNELFYLWLELC